MSQENEDGEKEILKSINRLSKNDSTFFRNLAVAVLLTLVFLFGAAMLLSAIFADACAARSFR